MQNIDDAVTKIMKELNVYTEMMTGACDHFEKMSLIKNYVDIGVMVQCFKLLWNGLSDTLSDAIGLIKRPLEDKND